MSYKTYVFSIPSTCREEFRVRAKSVEEAARYILNAEDENYECYIPESEFNIYPLTVSHIVEHLEDCE